MHKRTEAILCRTCKGRQPKSRLKIGSARNKTSDTNSRPSLEHTVRPLAKRKKAARACDRCRLHRIKCDEQKLCTQCVGIKAKCIVSYATSRLSRANNDGARSESPAVLPPRSSSP
ncbi:Zn(2)-C6 fungal-type DNA-binding domain [Penicillium roqueforti FM164]|uniref:Zn(2)-C6 fungal-type DNA-binding domain n=1 Tax=Penicillium roqueforti (strain FM164) TaxID=1365484 RepID=W6Q0R1_PENRF|nr:Zn(2)-C6 fungal-type DNA-binding domain [Penicillium roqueforti FM164]